MTETIDLKNTTISNQQQIILNALKKSPKTTIELRNNYGIINVGARMAELRTKGYTIFTMRVDCFTPDGIKHKRVAKYFLVKWLP
ncbi:MAG: helix-turn-helix domain-containing protein [Pseudomonadota bacterium]